MNADLKKGTVKYSTKVNKKYDTMFMNKEFLLSKKNDFTKESVK